MTLVKVGEVEFLIKFDSINTEFKKVLSQALEDAGIGDGDDGTGGGGADDDLKNQIEEINTRLRRMFVTTGKMDSYSQFMAKSENIVKYLSDEDHIEKLAESALASEATRKYLNITVEDMKEYSTVALPKAIEQLDKVSKHLIQTVGESVQNRAAWEKNKAMFGQALPMFEQVKGGNNIAMFIKFLVRRTLSEHTAVTAGLVDIATELELKFQASVAAGGEEEKVWRMAKFGFGLGETGEEISTPTEFIGAFLKAAQDKLSEEEIRDIILYGKRPTESDRISILNEVIESIIKDYEIQADTPIPSSISGMFETISKRLGGTAVDITDMEWEDFADAIKDIDYTKIEGELGGELETPNQFLEAFIREATGKLTDEEIKEIIELGNLPTEEHRLNLFEEIIGDLSKAYTLHEDNELPLKITDIFEKRAEEVGQIFYNTWDSFTKAMQKINANYLKTEGERLKVKFDFILEGMDSDMDDFEDRVEELTGKGGVLDDAKEQMERFDLTYFFSIIESKIDTAVANFDWNISTVQAMGSAMAKHVFSGILKIGDIDTDEILLNIQDEIKKLPLELYKQIFSAFIALGLKIDEIATRMGMTEGELESKFPKLFSEASGL